MSRPTIALSRHKLPPLPFIGFSWPIETSVGRSAGQSVGNSNGQSVGRSGGLSIGRLVGLSHFVGPPFSLTG